MNRMQIRMSTLFLMSASLALPGCGGQAQNSRGFFTSGSQGADQRADQRMAKTEQARGEGEGAGDKGPGANVNQALYYRLGGDKGVTAIVDDFVNRMLADPRVNFTRKGVTQGGFSIHRGRSVTWDASPANVAQLKKHFVQFIAVATGGPSEYDGKDIKEAHAGMHISNAEFDAAIGDLKVTLDKLHVDVAAQKELLSDIETTRPQIAEKR